MQRFLALVSYGLLRSLFWSYRFRFPETGAATLADGPYVFAIWHQNLFAGILAQTGTQHVVMVSRSRHADPLTHCLHRLGHVVVRGSSRRGERCKGGTQAKDEMVQVLASGIPGAITVDGPTGPAHEVKCGIVDMAIATGLPIIPYTAVANRYWTFNTWDRFRLPKPFATITVRYGQPLRIDPDTPREQFDELLAQLGQDITALDDGIA